MRRVLVAVLLAAAFVINPALGVVTATLYLARRHVAAYLALWRRLLGCELYTPLVAWSGVMASLLSPYAGVAKAMLVTISAIALYLAPTAPRASRAVSLFSTGLSLDVPLKPFVLAAVAAATFAAYKAPACGYICQRASALPEREDLAFVPALGVVCAFENGGADLSRAWLKLGGRYVKCVFGVCRAVGEEDFRRAVGTVDRYLPEPSAEDFKGLIHVVAPPQVAAKIVVKYFNTVVVVGGVEATRARLTSITKTGPDAAASVLASVFKLTGEQAAFLKDLLIRGSKEEALSWALRYPWLRPVVELWEGGEEPVGIVKSALPGDLGVADSLLYAYLKNAPILTDRNDVVAAANNLGLTVFLISSTPRGNFIVVGPAQIETPEGKVEVDAGRFLAYLHDMYFSDNF
jgi:hypothetical protein